MVPLIEIFADVMVDVPRVTCPHIWDPSDIGDERVVSAVAQTTSGAQKVFRPNS